MVLLANSHLHMYMYSTSKIDALYGLVQSVSPVCMYVGIYMYMYALLRYNVRG